MSEVSATVECPHCYLTGEHRIQCSDFTGQIDRESLARFLFDHSNASNDAVLAGFGPKWPGLGSEVRRGPFFAKWPDPASTNDGARVMEMMDSMARGLLEHLKVSKKMGV